MTDCVKTLLIGRFRHQSGAWLVTLP